MNTPQQVLKKMLSLDKFSAWLGLEIDSVSDGYCKLHYTVKEDMLNGFGSIHGGVLFSAADSAFAFACNSDGVLSVALDVHISYTRPAQTGDVLTVEAQEIHKGNKTGLYDISTKNQNGELVCMFKGTSYRTGKNIL
ncbi:MAG: hydroxyphenylacetyl-CoA thioesterase PaaI [Bacteroidetes bacterium]|nr:hydroxyphenylacetyl-CoA thioesterase PaaI [Bacteroidota bacterium]